MNINNFLNKENINTLWDVISDEEIFKFLSRDIQTTILSLFSNNINGFFETERTKTNSLIDLNKKYILLILNHINKKYSYQPNKIKIYDELPVKEHITVEEIQNDRKTQFEKDLQQRQQEFENSINIKVPPVPEFADKCEEIPISEMDKIIKEMTSKRNYDIEQINRNYSADVNQTNNWLMSQETSLKTEKLSPQKNKEEEPQKNKEEEPQKYSRFKFLNLEEVEPNIIISPTKKNVTWEDNKEINEIEENIFSKLKKVKKETSSDNIVLSFEDRPNEDRISNLETQIKTINNKMDLILDLLKQLIIKWI
jgi:hypothetical protein